MADPADNRVAVYIDFDNIIISRYNQLHGTRQFTLDRARNFNASSGETVGARIHEATVDFSAVLDYASSFGSIVISRAYADWSAPVNAGYRKQLIDRAVDLTQLFTTTQGMKNGADIRLAVDVVEDLFRLADLTHVVIVAGDSDYIALAQRCKRLGRYVVGIGVAGSTSRSLAAACDEFSDYDALPGIIDAALLQSAGSDEDTATATPQKTGSTRRKAAEQPVAQPVAPAAGPVVGNAAPDNAVPDDAVPDNAVPDDTVPDDDSAAPDEIDTRSADERASSLLARALRLIQAKSDTEWVYSAEAKSQMRRMDPAFNESAIGFRSFTDFVKSRADVAELDESSPSGARRLRLRPNIPAG